MTEALPHLEVFPIVPLAQRAAQDTRCRDRMHYRDNYFEVRSGGRTHLGIDIFAPRGSLVVSATSGRVVTASPEANGRTGYGATVRTGDWLLHYAHFDGPPLVARGQRVAAGEPLGAVGNTGNASNSCPHLHFQVEHRETGERWNPYPELYALERGTIPMEQPAQVALSAPPRDPSSSPRAEGGTLGILLLFWWWSRRRRG